MGVEKLFDKFTITFKLVLLATLIAVFTSLFSTAIFLSNQEVKKLQVQYNQDFANENSFNEMIKDFDDVDMYANYSMETGFESLVQGNLNNSIHILSQSYHRFEPLGTQIPSMSTNFQSIQIAYQTYLSIYNKYFKNPISNFSSYQGYISGKLYTNHMMLDYATQQINQYFSNNKQTLSHQLKTAIRWNQWIVELSFIFLILLPISMVFLFGKNIRKGMQQLTTRIQAYETGNLAFEQPITRKDEFGQIERVIQKMGFSLKNSLTLNLKIGEDILTISHELVQRSEKNQRSGISIQDLALSSKQKSIEAKEKTESIAFNISKIDEMSQVAQEYVGKGKGSVEEMNQLANTGNKQSQALATLIRQSLSDFNALFVQLDNINQIGKTIASFLKTIDEISGQTNLLALNAQIIAAHSGESGNGFRVISEEIRKLSDRSTFFSKEIREQIQSTQKHTTNIIASFHEFLALLEHLNGTTESFVENFDQIIKKTDQLVPQMADVFQFIDYLVNELNRIFNSIQSLSESSIRLNEDMETVTDHVEKQNQISNELAKEIHDLEEISVKLKENVGFFKLD